MTPQEKAKDLVYEMYSKGDCSFNTAKLCAIVTVKEIIKTFKMIKTQSTEINLAYWNDVRLEIYEITQ
jgi:hypothetical protein